MIEVELPDGSIAEFPDGTPDGVMKTALMKHSQTGQPGVMEDAARSGASGLRRGIESTLGAFGDTNKINANVAGWLAGKLGASPETRTTIEQYGRYANPLTAFLPSSEEVQSTTDPVLGAERYQPQTTVGEYARTIGEFAPAAAVGPGRLGTRIATQAVVPALGSETAGQFTEGTAAEPYARVAGALLGAVAPSVARRLVSPLPVAPQRQQMVQTLRDEGVDLTAGQASGRKGLQYRESELGGTAGARFMEQQGEQFTAAALRRAGVNANRATPEVIDDAFTRIGQQFDDLAARNRIVADQQFGVDLRATLNEYGNLVPESARAPIVQNITNDIVDSVRRNQGITGESYQALSSRLNRAARGTRDPELGQALRAIRDNLDDAMERSIATANPADAGAWREARNQYRNMLVIEKAATGAGESAAMGIISPSQLRNATVQQGRRAYARGQGDFADLTRAGEATMKPLPQSGTAPRLKAQNLGTGLLTMLGAGTGAFATGGTPLGAALGAAGGAILPPVLGRTLLSRPARAYLGNQLAGAPLSNSPSISALMAAMIANQGNVSGQ